MKIGRRPLSLRQRAQVQKNCVCNQSAGVQWSPSEPVMGELRGLLEGKQFGSLDEANAFLRQHMQQRNHGTVE